MSNWNGNISWLIYKSPDFYLVEFDAMKIMAILYPVDLICAVVSLLTSAKPANKLLKFSPKIVKCIPEVIQTNHALLKRKNEMRNNSYFKSEIWSYF